MCMSEGTHDMICLGIWELFQVQYEYIGGLN